MTPMTRYGPVARATLNPCPAAQALTSARRIADAINSGNAFGVHAKHGTPSDARLPAVPASNDGAP